VKTLAIILGAAALLLYAGGWLAHRAAERHERREMGEEQHDRYLQYAASLGPGAPCNAWMLLANACYLAAGAAAVAAGINGFRGDLP
jgi:hypothetical protein